MTAGPARFSVEGQIMRDAFCGPTFAYLTLKATEKLYFDVACFEDGPLDQVRDLKGGQWVEVKGTLGKRKIKGSDRDGGRGIYEIQLVAREVTPLKVKVTDAEPRQRPPSAPQAAQQRGWGDDDIPF